MLGLRSKELDDTKLFNPFLIGFKQGSEPLVLDHVIEHDLNGHNLIEGILDFDDLLENAYECKVLLIRYFILVLLLKRYVRSNQLV